jgi:hypothetical protein
MKNLQRKIDRADHAQGPYPILESLQPRYREHKIEGWEGFDEIEVEDECGTKRRYNGRMKYVRFYNI